MPTNKDAFVQMLWPAALQAAQRTGIDPRIIVAQAAQETGWGEKAPGNNYFGIKSHGKGGGQTFTTHEVINGQRVKMQDSFRQYAGPADSVMGYADFMLENPRYKPVREAQGLDAQIAALGQSGYATDPNYASSIRSIATNLPTPSGSMPPPEKEIGGDSMVARSYPGLQPASMFGSMAPQPAMAGAPTNPGIPNAVADYANAPEAAKPGDRIASFFQALGEGSQASAPRPGPHPGGPSPGQATALMNVLANPNMGDLLRQKRMFPFG